MKSIQLLKSLINITYYILLIGLLFYPLFMVYGIFADNVGILVNSSGDSTYYELNEDGYTNGGLGGKDYVVIALSFIKSLLFFLSIHYLRKAVVRMIDVTMYDTLVSTSLGLTGNCIIIYAIFDSMFRVIKRAVYSGQFTIGLDLDSFNSFIFLIILGLFFLLIGKVITRGMELKQENDLTI